MCFVMKLYVVKDIIFIFCYFQPIYTPETNILADHLSRSLSTPEELRCGEYSFNLKLNPWQHPIFDENVHRLLALVTSLRHGCGGVIYLMDDGMQNVTHEIFQVSIERLTELIGRKLDFFPSSSNIARVALPIGTCRSWAAILLNKGHCTRKYPPMVNLEIDMFGKIYENPELDAQSHDYRETERSLVSSGHETKRSTLPPTCNQDDISRQIEAEESASALVLATLLRLSAYFGIPHVDFSFCSRLDWIENKKNWEEYVKIKEVKIDDIVGSCPVWKPTQPITITPNEDSLRYLFGSDTDMRVTLSAVNTKGPGCAVVCRTWRFHISDGNICEDLPPGHICDILTVTDTSKLSFWVVVDSLGEENILSQMEYLMTTGRMLKYKIVQKGEGGDFSNLWINCRLLPLNTSNATEKIKLRLSESEDIQSHLCDMYHDPVDFELLQRALVKLILSKESPLKRCVGEHTSITLSAQQAEVLKDKEKVNYITGPAGSGKSYTAAFLYKLYGKERSVYICTTKAFLEYLKFNECTGTLVLGDEDLLREIKIGTFENKICVIIDDCHNFKCTKNSLKDLFHILKKNVHMSLFVFADNDYQSFDRERQQAVHDCIMYLTRTEFKQDPVIFPLTDIYRNTRKLVAFIQAAIQDVHDGYQNIKSANEDDGEGVEFIRMSNLWQNSPGNDLVVYLRSLLFQKNYNQSEVAILLDAQYTHSDKEQCKQMLEEHIPDLATQSADVFPRTGVIVDSVNNFVGLDAIVTVFLISNSRKGSSILSSLPRILRTEDYTNIYNPRYEVFLASRAINKAVFVVPEFHDDLVHQMKFDNFQVCICGKSYARSFCIVSMGKE